MDTHLLYLLLGLSAASVCWKSRPVFSAWLRARKSAAPISFLAIWSIYLRNVHLDAVVDAHLSAHKAGVPVPLSELVAHARAGGDIRAVVVAYIETLRAGSRIEFARVCQIELEDISGGDSL